MFLCLPALLVAQESRLIKGKITDGSEPLSDVSVVIEGESTAVFTNSEGRYEVEAAPGDVLLYTYTGMKDIRIRVEDVTRFLNLVMVPDYTELEEVTMTKRLKSQVELQQEYPTNDKILRTTYGFIDAEARKDGFGRTDQPYRGVPARLPEESVFQYPGSGQLFGS